MSGIHADPTYQTATISDVKTLSLSRSPVVAMNDDGGGGDSTAFGRRLRNLRLQLGLSQKQLANFSSLSIRAIRDLENGRVRHPRTETLRQLADALGVTARQMDRLANDESLEFLAGTAEPAVGGPFIGRDQELAALITMLSPEQHCLVTITGIEGVGKTRLALEAAHALKAAQQLTVLWLPLDDGRLRSGDEPEGAPTQPAYLSGVVGSGPESRRRLVETIGQSSALLVLDGARPQDGPAKLTADLVAACPRLRILVTTRNPVGMPLDTVFPLAPLPVPLPDTESADLGKVPSVALLLAQMKRIHPAFRPDPLLLADAARICRALDGLPAALESTARWSFVYSLRQVADQLITDPLAVARRPQADHRQPCAFASVHHTIAALSSRQRDLLSATSDKTPRDMDGYRSVPEVAEKLGLTPAECADDIYHLLVLGLLRRIDHHGVAMFKPLNIISIAGQNAPA